MDCECGWDNFWDAFFLNWLKLYLKKDLDFEEAWILAREGVQKKYNMRILEYELHDDDQDEVELWMERLEEFGMSPEKSESMAKDLIGLLRRCYLGDPGPWLSDEDELRSRELLGDLWNDKDEQALKSKPDLRQSSLGPLCKNASATAGRPDRDY